MYVAAFAPDEGETGGGLAQKFPQAPLFGEIQPIADGYLLLSHKGVMEDFAQDLSPTEQKAHHCHPVAHAGRCSWHTNQEGRMA